MKKVNLPDFRICETEDIGLFELPGCLVTEPSECYYAMFYVNTYLCIHPQRKQFLKKTSAGANRFLTIGIGN